MPAQTLSDEQREFLGRVALTMRIIVGALAAGVVFFLVVAVVVRSGQAPSDPLVAYLALGLALIALLAWAAVPGLISNRGLRAIADGTYQLRADSRVPKEMGDAGPIAVLYQTRLIVSAAVLEGAAFFNLIAYLIEGQALSLAVAVGLLLALLAQFPRQGRVEDWVTAQLANLEQMRGLAA